MWPKRCGQPYAESEVCEERPSYHRLWVDGFELTVVSSDRPYMPSNPEGGTRDLRLRDVIARHRAATLIDCWSAPEGIMREASTDLMGRILFELMDEETLGVYAFHTQRMNAADETLRAMLREGQGMEAMSKMTTVPITGVSPDDEAIAEARARWPEFAAAFAANPRLGGDFVVKAPFGEKDRIEHLWLSVVEIAGPEVTGVVANDPIALPRPRRGEQVAVSVDEIRDWVYQRDGEAVGLFTAKVLKG